MDTLDLPCIRLICDNLSALDLISFTASCRFIHDTIEADVEYLIKRCQTMLDCLISSKTIFRLNKISFGLDRLFDNIFNMAFLNLDKFPWKWFLTNLYNGVVELDNKNLVVGKIWKEEFFRDNLLTMIFINRIFYVSNDLICIGIQFKTNIIGLRISNNHGMQECNIYQCNNAREIPVSKIGLSFNVNFIEKAYEKARYNAEMNDKWHYISRHQSKYQPKCKRCIQPAFPPYPEDDSSDDLDEDIDYNYKSKNNCVIM